MKHDNLTATYKIALIRFHQRNLPSDSEEFTELQIEILQLQDQLASWHN